MDIENATTVHGHSNTTLRYVYFIIVVMAVILTTSWFFFGKDTLLNIVNKFDTSPNPKILVVNESDIKLNQTPKSLGSLYLTMTQPGNNLPTPYWFDVANRELIEVANPTIYTYYNDFSPNKLIHAFIGTTKQGQLLNNAKYGKYLEVYTAPSHPTNGYPDSASTTKITTDDNILYKDDVSVNNNGDVLFTAQGLKDDPAIIDIPTNNARAKVSDRFIFLSSQNFKSKIVANGTNPKWLDNSRFIFIGPDGLYLKDLNKDTISRIFRTNLTMLTSAKIDLSDDNSIVALSLPEYGQVLILKIENWDTTIIKTKSANYISTRAVDIAISPDSNTLAVQAIDLNIKQNGPNPRIEFYSTDTLQKTYSDYSLKEFGQKRMFLTDWR